MEGEVLGGCRKSEKLAVRLIPGGRSQWMWDRGKQIGTSSPERGWRGQAVFGQQGLQAKWKLSDLVKSSSVDSQNTGLWSQLLPVGFLE